MRPDRRNERTRGLLRRALVELVQEQGYAAVTVQDITARANLARATFYLHYQHKHELLLDSLRESLDALRQTASALDALAWFQHAARQPALYRALWSEPAAAVALADVRGWLAEAFLAGVSASPGEPRALAAAHFLAGALLAFTGWWLDSGLTPEQAAELYNRLAEPALVALR